MFKDDACEQRTETKCVIADKGYVFPDGHAFECIAAVKSPNPYRGYAFAYLYAFQRDTGGKGFHADTLAYAVFCKLNR